MPNPMHLTKEQFDYRYVKPADRSTQQPLKNRVMHESKRWWLYPYECMRQEETGFEWKTLYNVLKK